ncbi:MAG: amidohydrolase family protein [Planctomycetes bacterium]|nr:amidohydrolase family protein [Planctomycetota bacterium]
MAWANLFARAHPIADTGKLSLAHATRQITCVGALAILAIVAPAAFAEWSPPIAITNLTIVTGRGTTIESGTIVISKGRISDVGTEVEIPADARTIDGSGLFAYPGFIDALAHLGLPKVERTVDQRQLTEDVRPDPKEDPLPATRLANRRGIHPQWRALERYAPEEKTWSGHRNLGFTAALIAPRSGILGGTSDLVVLADKPVRQCVLAANVAMHASFKPGEEGDYPRTLLGIFSQFRQAMLDAQWHDRSRRYSERHPTTEMRVPTDAALDALKPVLERAQRIVFEANTEREIRRALDLGKEFNLDVLISGGREAWKVVDRIKAERIGLIVSLAFEDEPKPARREREKTLDSSEAEPAAPDDLAAPNESGTDEETSKLGQFLEPIKLREERRRLWEQQVTNVIRLHEAGIPFALRAGDFEKPSKFFKHLRMIIERGLPESAAVTALTQTPAELFGLGEQLGVIARGRIACLTLMDRPLSHKKAKVKFLFVDGVEIDLGDGKNGKKKDDEAKDEPESSDSADPADDQGPVWQVETKADRKPATQTGGNVMITSATIVPVSSPPISPASILIRDGKIESIGSGILSPPGVTVINGLGLFVVPGFVDCHSHLGIDAGNESTLAISAEVRIADVLDPDRVGIYRAIAGGTTTHHVMHGSANPIGGQNMIVKLKYGRPLSEMIFKDAPATIKFALGENVTHANSRKRRGERFPVTRMGVEATIRSALQQAKAYESSWREYQVRSQAGEDVRTPRRDLRLEALAKVLSGELTVHAHCYRSDEILRLMQVAEDYGFRIGTLQHVLEGYRIAPEIARHGAGASTFASEWAYKLEAYHAMPYNAAFLTRRGVNVSVNSDSANTIRYLGQEAAKCIRWGDLSPDEALALVTLNPAKQLQIDDRVGSLEVGKDGDLAIFTGHPLNTFSRCVMTIIDGEVYFEAKRTQRGESSRIVHLPDHPDRTTPKSAHHAFAIVNATVHPISSPIIENGRVIIVEDRIHAIGPDAEIPPGAGVVDAAGLHVYPGLIDAGSSLGLTEIGAIRGSRDARDIGKFNPHLRAASAIHPHSEHIRVTRSAGTTTALAVPTGGNISGQSVIIRLDGWTAPEMIETIEYAMHMKIPSLPVHLKGTKEEKKKKRKAHDKEIKALRKYIEKAKLYAKAKAAADGDATSDFEVDLALEALLPYVRGEKPVVFHTRRYKDIVESIAFAEKYGLRCILSGAQEAWKLADELAEKKIPVILGTPLSYPAGDFEPWDSVYRCAHVLNKAGVRFCFASRSASSAYNLGIQAGMAVAHGLPAERGEHALTLGAAEILGLGDRLGSLEVGKRADIILTTGSPLQATTQVTHVFIAGKPIELSNIHTEMYEKFEKRPPPTLPPLPELVGPPNLTAR